MISKHRTVEVEKFTSLGSINTKTCGSDEDIKARIRQNKKKAGFFLKAELILFIDESVNIKLSFIGINNIILTQG